MPLLLLLLAGKGFALERVLVLDPARSTIEVQVQATFDSFAGRLAKFQSDIAVDPEARRTTRAWVGFDFTDLQTGRERRDRDMLSWTENERFPTVEFRMDALEPSSDGPSRVHGSLRMHGVERATVFPVSFLMEGALCAIDGEALIDYRDYGLPLIRKFLFLTVDPSLRIRFHLQGRLASEATSALAAHSPP